MRIALLIFTLCFSILAGAQESRMKKPKPAPEDNQLQIYLLDLEMRYEKDAGGEFVDRKPLNLGISYRAPNWSVLFEYSKFDEQTGNATLSIDRKHEEMMAWGRWHLWRYKVDRALMSIYGGIGGGAYQETVRTELSGAGQSNQTGYKTMLGFSAGADMSYQLTKSFGVIGALEGRGLTAEDFDPNPTWGAVLRTGIFFVW